MVEERLKLFYEEPTFDRWVPFDRHPRRVVRRIIRGPDQIGGVQRWFLNLCHGLRQLGTPYDVNDYQFFRRSRSQPALVIGKSHVVPKIPRGVPIIYGPGIDSHPSANGFWGSAQIVRLLISCDWFARMYERDLPIPIPISVWPAGIEIDKWVPGPGSGHGRRVIVYDKVRWERARYEPELILPIIAKLVTLGYDPVVIRYGFYREEHYRALLSDALAMVFLCEHETQGFAYQQAMSCDVPIFAWDRGGLWKDPSYYPKDVLFEPVTSVPYFDERCGRRFLDSSSFDHGVTDFLLDAAAGKFSPRAYVCDMLDPRDRARQFVDIARDVTATACSGS